MTRLGTLGFVVLAAFAGALQLSIASAQILLTGAIAVWVGWLVVNRARPEVPAFFWPLAAYAGATLTSAAFSSNPAAGLVDSKQLLLFAIVPVVYQFARGTRAPMIVQVIITVGAATAAFGVVQYAVLEYNHLGQRPQGSMSHYMTYSGLIMLVVTLATGRILFDREDRVWPALVMPALVVSLILTFTRSAWVGACAGVALLLALKDFKLVVALPVVAAILFALAPTQVANRFYSMFDPHDPTNRDRVAMLKAGAAMIRSDPLTGVGPNMVQALYPAYRDPSAVRPINPHLHNDVVQIAAERGLPALAVWLWFVIDTARRLLGMIRQRRQLCLAAVALASLVAMLAAGLFEYNFGDSEFLMLLLVVLTLPFAAERIEAENSEGRSRLSAGGSRPAEPDKSRRT